MSYGVLESKVLDVTTVNCLSDVEYSTTEKARDGLDVILTKPPSIFSLKKTSILFEPLMCEEIMVGECKSGLLESTELIAPGVPP